MTTAAEQSDQNELRDILLATAGKLFEDLSTHDVIQAAEGGTWPVELWDALEESGIPLALVPENQGGAGLPFADAMAVLRLSGAYAIPVPLAETLLGTAVLSDAGLAVPEGPLSIAPVNEIDRLTLTQSGDNWLLSGTATRVPWSRQAGNLVVVALAGNEKMVACVPTSGLQSAAGTNLACEPRDTLTFEEHPITAEAVAVASPGSAGDRLYELGALMRSVQLAGALRRVLEVAVEYVNERKQFGRPLGKFQAIQQQLALLACEVVAAGAAVDSAIDAAHSKDARLYIAIAKARAGEAVSYVAETGHQVHGAIGFTQEYKLHHSTKRLWSWRDEFGAETKWQDQIGRSVAAVGADALWPLLTRS
jgi:acyl-CoA dehydrogenase